MKPNITMIGMPSSGKSTIGVLLAKRLGFSFVDVDIVIQEKEGRLLKEIIAQEGMDGFLKVEERINAELDVALSVIAPGGSVIYGEKAMEHLKEISEVVYLKMSYEEMEKRIGNVVDRGVALKPDLPFGTYTMSVCLIMRNTRTSPLMRRERLRETRWMR